VRLFVALNLPASEKQRLHEATRALRAGAPEIRWTAPESIHLTLKFLGEVADARVDALATSLTEVAARHAPLTLSVGGVGGFPSLGRARVWWLGIAHDDDLLGLHADVAARLEAEGFPREARAFSPHITIGRGPRGARPVPAARAQELAAAVDYAATWHVETLDLMRSHLRRSGAEYEPVARLSLGEAP
jgi:RNA 2',3'-cyclic 3'-phosphodiesterase